VLKSGEVTSPSRERDGFSNHARHYLTYVGRFPSTYHWAGTYTQLSYSGSFRCERSIEIRAAAGRANRHPRSCCRMPRQATSRARITTARERNRPFHRLRGVHPQRQVVRCSHRQQGEESSLLLAAVLESRQTSQRYELR
jgi:hypothetical protein